MTKAADLSALGSNVTTSGNLSSASTLSLQTNSTTAVTINSSQNVGIGTAGPSYKLDVAGQVASQDAYLITANSSGTPSAGAFIFRPASNTIALGTASTERMRIDSSGNVGIGTTSPSFKLDVAGNGRIGNVYNTGLTIAQSGNSITYPADNTLAFNTLSNERMRIDNSGNVGIGTTSPTHQLEISGGSGTERITQTLDTATAGLNLIGASNQGDLGRINIWQTATGAKGGYIRFDTCASGTNTFTERMRIDSNGNVGVGRNPNGYGRIAISFSATDANNNFTGLGIDVQAATSGAKYVHFYNEAGAGIGHINRNGTTNAVQYTTSSDYRLKENIQPMQGALSLISQLKPCTYDWKQECGGGVGKVLLPTNCKRLFLTAFLAKKMLWMQKVIQSIKA